MSASLKVHATLGPLSFDVEGSPMRIAALLRSLHDSRAVAHRYIMGVDLGGTSPTVYKLPGRSPSVTKADLRAALDGEKIAGLTDREQIAAWELARDLEAKGEL